MINPPSPIKTVFVFPIHNEVEKGKSIYNATRGLWNIPPIYHNLRPSYAVGLVKSLSVGSFEIERWILAVGFTNKYEFISPNHPNPSIYQPLSNEDWSNVLAQAMGFWQFGNYLIVEFDGNGHFRIARGNPDHITWHNCI